MKAFTVERHDREDDHKIFELQRLVYPDHPIYCDQDLTHRYWQWRYFSNPSIENFVYVIKSQDGNTIAGMRPMSIVPVKVGERIVRVLWLTAVITHPDYRNQGIFSALVKHSMEKAQEMGVAFAYTFPNKNSYPIYQKMKTWRTIANIYPMIKILDYNQIITKCIKSFLSASTELHLESKVQVSASLANEEDLGCFAPQSLATDIDHTYDELWEDTSQTLPVAFPRNSAYLKWRYLSNPVFTYEIIEDRSTNGRLEGYAVIGCQCRKRLKIGLLVDILHRPGREDVGRRLIQNSVSRLKAHNADVVCALAGRRHSFGSLLSQTGFWHLPKFFNVRRVNLVGSILKSNTDIQETIFDFNNWYLTWGDTDNA